MIDKTSANYCTYFRPAHGAWRGDADAGRERAEDDLAELFGLEPTSRQSAAEKSRESVAVARRELDALFGLESESESAADSDARSTTADSEDRER